MKKPVDDFQELFRKSKEVVEDESAWDKLIQKIKEIFSTLPETDYLEFEEEEME